MSTNRPVTIYISAASDLMAEREALARLIAELPVTLAWHIAQTPVASADALDLEALHATDMHLLVMGSDIRAPVGLEWHVARRTHRTSVAFLKRGIPRTPAGQVFKNGAGVVWQPFTDAADLSRQVQRVLAEHLVRHAPLYALTPAEMAQLEALPTAEAPTEGSARGEEAGHSAVILSRERFVPSQGVIIGESHEEKKEQ